MLAIIAPGQGAQKPGMLTPWLEVTGLSTLAGSFADAAGIDLVRLGTTAGADEIKDTAVTQPLVVASALLAAAVLELPRHLVCAGHSVGELAAAALAGVIAPQTAVRTAGIRGAAMGEACALTSTSMSAVLGGDNDTVLAALASLDLVGANVNGGGQIVAAGTTEALAALAADPPAGARIIPLPVAGAFHTRYMAPAQQTVQDFLQGVTAVDPTRPLLTNCDGSVVTDGRAYLDLLAAQVTRPVRWDACMATLSDLGVTGVVELPPAGTLIGLVRRDLRGVATLALKTPDDLDRAAAFIAEHSTAPPAERTVPSHGPGSSNRPGSSNSPVRSQA